MHVMFEILQSLSILLYTMRQNLGGARKQGSTHNEGINADLWLIPPRTEHEKRDIRERSSALYLKGNLPWLCYARIMAKESTTPKSRRQRK